MNRSLIPVVYLLLTIVVGGAAEFFVDPVHGKPGNDGSSGAPWASLQGLIDDGLVETQAWGALPYTAESALVAKNAGAPIRAGDTIRLRSGDYGELRIHGHYNRGLITIAAAEGAVPRFTSIVLRSGAHWALRGLHVSPEFNTEIERARTLVDLQSHGWQGPIQDILVEDCVIRSADETGDWTAEQWNALSCNGIEADGTRIIVRRNRLKNVNFGISVDASHSLVEHNVVDNFAGDGLRGLGDFCVFQYNLVRNCYDVNANHDDGFQSWSVGPEGVGSGEVVGMVLRGNTIINYTDPDQPHRGALQGIGCFDGTFVDWVVENNVVIVDHYHGITLLGARDCRIVSNVVIDPEAGRPGPAWVRIGKHKNGTPSADCLVENNLTTALSIEEGPGMVVGGNVLIDER